MKTAAAYIRVSTGEDFFVRKTDEAAEDQEVRPFFGQTLPNGFNPNADIILVTESGYLSSFHRTVSSRRSKAFSSNMPNRKTL